jgi:4-hydroxy-4-methyl-2-oxoglutarate aldolase
VFTLNTLPPPINPTLVQKLVRAEPATIGHFRDWGFMDPGIKAMQQDVRIAGKNAIERITCIVGTLSNSGSSTARTSLVAGRFWATRRPSRS